jgi:hypothetical protein
VADRNSRSGLVAAAPSGQFGGDPELDIDAAMERLNQSRQAALSRAAQSTTDEDELEQDDDETAEELNHTDDAPEYDDFDDDDDDEAEANTPSDDDENEEVTSLESADKRQKPKKSGTPPDARKSKAPAPESDEDDDEEVVRLSRKQRGKLIEELRQQVLKSEQEKTQIEQRVRAQQEEDERLAKEVQRALGSEEEYEKAMEEGLQGNESQAEKARIWKSNRAFFNKLVNQAERRVNTNLTRAYWDTAKELEGVDLTVLRDASLPQVLKHVHEAGKASSEGKDDDRIEALEAEIETWKGKYRALKAKAGASKRSPVGAGGEPASTNKKPVDWKKKYLGKDGLPTDEAETLVMQRGFEALIQPSRRK